MNSILSLPLPRPQQHRHLLRAGTATKVYEATVSELDTRGIGGVKAWFCGARKPIPVPGSTNWMTWAIFSDKSPAG